jgi:hypothetical protein
MSAALGARQCSALHAAVPDSCETHLCHSFLCRKSTSVSALPPRSAKSPAQPTSQWHGGRHARYPRAPGLAQSYIPRWAAAAEGLFDFALGEALWTGKSRAVRAPVAWARASNGRLEHWC